MGCVQDTIFARHGLPAIIRSDNGTSFNGKEFEVFRWNRGMAPNRVTPLWPNANSQVERFTRTLKKSPNSDGSRIQLEDRNKSISTKLSCIASQHHRSSTSKAAFRQGNQNEISRTPTISARWQPPWSSVRWCGRLYCEWRKFFHEGRRYQGQFLLADDGKDCSMVGAVLLSWNARWLRS